MASEKRTAADPVSRKSTLPPGAVLDVAPPSKEEANAIEQDLLQNALSYDFFYAVGMMERLHPAAVRVGGDGPYAFEAIRFRHDPSLAFKPGDISKVRYVEVPRAAEDRLEVARHRFEVTTTFIGLTGTVSPLPLYLAEEIEQAQDSSVEREFLDLFHHRIISFVYRLGVKYDLAREYSVDAADAWSRRILALAGFDLWAERKLRYIPIWRVLRLAPLLAHRTRSGRVIETAIEDACEEALEGACVRIEQFTGDWTPLDEDQRMALGRENHVLGQSALLGLRCYDRAGKARIVIGPLGENFRRFLADGDMFLVVLELLHLLTEEPIHYELELVIHERHRPPCRLGAASGSRMGVDAWIASQSASGRETRLQVDMPKMLPKDPSSFALGWQSQPQRRPRA